MGAALRAELELRAAARAITWAQEALGLSYTEIGSAVGASARSAMRWAAGVHPPRRGHRDGLERLHQLRQLLTAAFGDDAAAAQEWLHQSVPALRGRTPMSLISAGQVDDVIGVLAGLESGAFL